MMKSQQKHQESLTRNAQSWAQQSDSGYADRLARLVVLGRMPPESIVQAVSNQTGLAFDRPEAYSDWIDTTSFCPNVKQMFRYARLDEDPERALVLFLPPLNSLAASIVALLTEYRNPQNTWIAYFRANSNQLDLVNLSCLLQRY